jgi:hypothetical protein
VSPGPVAAGLFAIGVAVLVMAEAEALRVAGAIALLAAIALGVFAIATPEFLERDREE